ncbi:hypothetical protein V6N11_066641 [Hibiscus sabdariffa]|uniref:Uncharacterized protein n=1 Tax=Hibiscus sabdariffa TaxID=183260 RepID=A0ABR1ZG94_9ROSI
MSCGKSKGMGNLNQPHLYKSITKGWDRSNWANDFRFLNCSSVVKSETSWSPPSHGDLQMVPSGVALEKLELEKDATFNASSGNRHIENLADSGLIDNIQQTDTSMDVETDHQMFYDAILKNPGDTFLNISKWYNVVSSQLVTSFLGKAVDVGFGDKVALDELFKANAADDNDDMDLFGMKLCRKRDIPEEKFSNAFLWYGPEESHFVVELT